VGEAREVLRRTGQAENTLIIVASDNGWQMPRGLANLYDSGVRIPFIATWTGRFRGGRVVDDFVNVNDVAPTFPELAGLRVPAAMTARSLTNVLFSERSERVEAERDRVYTARERHAFCWQYGKTYPGRAIRTHDYLYIRNFEPDRWPAGDPPLYGDVDAHMLHIQRRPRCTCWRTATVPASLRCSSSPSRSGQGKRCSTSGATPSR
jgi:arylsulfatase A-like enzyme